jgi:serine/threonine protein kinase/Tfp pilus assembly protein PilF
MPEEYWDKLQQIFHAAIALTPGERSAFLDQACGDDESLRKKVYSLLNAHQESLTFVDQPVYKAAAQLLIDEPALKPSQFVSHYQILSLLGEGGMGRVYLAEDTKLKRKVSLKFLSDKFIADKERVHRFEQEARAISALNHPNILTIHEISESDHKQFIAAEFIDGETLRNRLGSSLDIDDAIEISIQVGAALVAAHRLNIVHRDLKPENIMIRREDGLIKVLDFGLAKMSAVTSGSSGSVDADAETQLRVQTQDGLVLGTVAYMSPEQARGNKVDERTDIWSLGVVLYEMVAGCTPFMAGTSHEIIAGILSKDPAPPLARYRRQVPARLEEIVEKALTKNRDERYQTSKDLLIDLKRLKQSLEVRAGIERSSPSREETNQTKPDHVLERTAEAGQNPTVDSILNSIKRHKRGVTAAVSTLAMLTVMFTFLYLWRAKHTAAAEQPGIKSLAVLPLKSFDNGENLLGLGIADAIIKKTSQTGELTVRPTSAVLKYVKAETDSLEAARQLSADAVLEGTTQRVGDRLRVTVNLLRTRDGASLWADSFDMPAADIFAIQDKISQQVATRLQLHLDSSHQSEPNRYPTNTIAYQLYIRGTFNLDERGYDEVGSMRQMGMTIDLFQQAIKADPNYAPAHAQLAFAYAWTALFIEPGKPNWAELAREEIKRSQELGPDIAETHLAKGMLLWSAYEGYKNVEALREIFLAKQLNPNSTHGELVGVLAHVGLEDRASQELQRGLQIDPTSQSLADLTMILPFLRADADAWLVERQKYGDVPSLLPPWYYMRKGRLDDAQKSLEQRLTKAPNDSSLLKDQALLLALRGNLNEAEARSLQLLANIPLTSDSRHHVTYNAACIYALAGKSDEAVKWLIETANTGFPSYPLFERDPYLNQIRTSPQFVQFMSEQKAQWEKLRQEFDN